MFFYLKAELLTALNVEGCDAKPDDVSAEACYPKIASGWVILVGSVAGGANKGRVNPLVAEKRVSCQ
jgi:hypothetical protein